MPRSPRKTTVKRRTSRSGKTQQRQVSTRTPGRRVTRTQTRRR